MFAYVGITKIKQLVSYKYYWKRIVSDIACFVTNCMCIMQKPQHNKIPRFLKPLEIPARPYQHLTIDYTSLPIDKNSYDYAFVIVDWLSKKTFSIFCHQTITIKKIARLFLDHWTRNFGTPDSIISDWDPQFLSIFWNEYCHILSTKI